MQADKLYLLHESFFTGGPLEFASVLSMEIPMHRILTVIFITLIAVSCKTKRKSTSIASPTPLGEPGDSCAFNVASVTKVPELPAVPAGALKVTDIGIPDILGDRVKLEFSVRDNTHPDVIIYEGYQRDGSAKFSGAAFGVSDYDSKAPAGTLSITAWACVEETRRTGGSYTLKTYAKQNFYCGSSTEKTISNKNNNNSPVNFALAQVNEEIEETCMKAYDRMTSDENLRKAVASKNYALVNSINGLIAMKKGPFTAKCVADGPDLATTSQFASGANLAVASDGCLPEVDDNYIDDYISTTPPPVSDPTEFILPPTTTEPETTSSVNNENNGTEPQLEETVSATTTPEDAKAACKYDNEKREEMGIGGAEWDPQKGICFYHNNEKEVVNSIEPSIPKSEVPQDEVVVAPQNQSKGGLSKGDTWGMSLFLVGGLFAAGLATYKYQGTLTSEQQRNAGLTETDTIKQVELLVQENELNKQYQVYSEALSNPNLPDEDRRLLTALSNEMRDRIEAQRLNSELVADEAKLAETKQKIKDKYKGFTGGGRNVLDTLAGKEKATLKIDGVDYTILKSEADTLRTLETDINTKSANLIETLWRAKIADYDAASVTSLKNEADQEIEKAEKALAGASTDTEKATLAKELNEWKDYRQAFDDVAVIKANTQGPDYLEDISTKMKAAVPEMLIDDPKDLGNLSQKRPRSDDIDFSKRIDVRQAPSIDAVAAPVSKSVIDTEVSKLDRVKAYVSDWKGKGVAASLFAAIIGAGTLIFSLSGDSGPYLAQQEGSKLSFLEGCKAQLLKTGTWAKKCQEVISK